GKAILGFLRLVQRQYVSRKRRRDILDRAIRGTSMDDAPVPYGRKTQRAPAIPEIHILWITAGLGCDGDTISMTAATQPSIEELVLGAIPGLPKVHLHNPVLAYENGDEFMRFFHEADAGLLQPFLLVIEGSIPNEKNKSAGYWAGFGRDKDNGQPMTTCEWIDRLASRAWAVLAAGTCAAYGGI